MYDVWYVKAGSGNAYIFVCDIPTLTLAESIARSLMEDFGDVIDRAWTEED